MKNICRAITYYINYIPSNEKKLKCNYLTIGTIDGINVSDNLLDSGCNNIRIMDVIRKEQKRFEHELKGMFSAHQIFVIRTEDVEGEVFEKDFWQRSTEMPFYFFCRCQILKAGDMTLEVKKNIEESLNANVKIAALTYLTYDENDLFIVIKAAEYNIGVKAINQLHNNINLILDCKKNVFLKNSYTVFAVDREWVEALEEERKELLNHQQIKYLQISVMEKLTGNMKEVTKKISQCLKQRITELPILGEYDDIIIAKDVGWGDFLSLFGQNGLYSNELGTYKENLAAVSTLIITELENIESVILQDSILVTDKEWDEELKAGDKEKLRRYNEKLDYLRRMSEEVKCFDLTVEFDVIFNTLSEFSGEIFNDYIFYSLLEPIEVMLKIIENAEVNNQEESKQNANFLRENKEFYYDFLNGISTYIQAYNVSDKHRIQGLGINTKLYNVPIKISAFYNAFLCKVTEILNVVKESEKDDWKCNYVFLTVPSMQYNINVSEFFPNLCVKDRLIVMRMPEAGFFNMGDMMNILTHETAHYVGRTFRKREERLLSYVKTVSHIFAIYIFCQYEGLEIRNKLSFPEAFESCIENRLFDRIIRGLERKQAQMQNDEKALEKKIYHFSVLRPTLKEVMNEIIENELGLVFAPITEISKDTESVLQTMVYIQEITECFMASHPNNPECVDFDSLVKILCMFYEECFADIMAILILGIKPKDYIECLMRESVVQNMKESELEDSEVMFRIGTVIFCMNDELDEKQGWGSEFLEDTSDAWRKLGVKAMRTCYMNEMSSERFGENIYATIANESVFLELIKYLKQCVQKFKDVYCQNDKMRQEVGVIQDVYSTLVKTVNYNAEEQLRKITKIVDEYRDNFLGDKEEAND